MPWIVLLVSAVFEAVWATALGMSNGFTETGPTLVFLGALAVSMLGLGWAVKHIPIGTAYAVWVGIGAALTVTYAMATGTESVSVGKVVFIAGIIASVIGLKLIPGRSRTEPQEDAGR
ncbi:DMT family transporter [Nocardiopsis ansamitocini]|uniref:QacE family quaternary ammonium compound efflux SMR transporter n=1 Tax=Nocardiopsis ansamitocini TaxID=1670832 RepID=A0A9W6PB65_9ACTN|nr:multidrug efflux SMR transporter [Nocardiopsis ansamitocini]GLU50302.1 QacE family quaternary ammonium compound efflux SMR transporter [Nocardiopsis ansamitocini]